MNLLEIQSNNSINEQNGSNSNEFDHYSRQINNDLNELNRQYIHINNQQLDNTLNNNQLINESYDVSSNISSNNNDITLGDIRLYKDRERKAKQRENEPIEKKLLRRVRDRELKRSRRAAETPEETKLRLFKDRERKKLLRSTETLEQKTLRRLIDREKKRKSRLQKKLLLESKKINEDSMNMNNTMIYHNDGTLHDTSGLLISNINNYNESNENIIHSDDDTIDGPDNLLSKSNKWNPNEFEEFNNISMSTDHDNVFESDDLSSLYNHRLVDSVDRLDMINNLVSSTAMKMKSV